MKNGITVLILTFFSLTGYAQPHAEFLMSSGSGCINETISFINLSFGGVVSYEWDFGDGSPLSNAVNPTYVYSDTGTFTVTLTVTDGSGLTDSWTEDYIVRPPIASFVLIPSIGCALPHTVFFTDQSTFPDTWFWDFGDGNTSTLQNPVHNYTSVGTYVVTLTVTDTIYGCWDTKTDTVKVGSPAAVVDGGFGHFGCGPLTVNFTESSTVPFGSITDWFWDFGDGNTSTQQEPTHIYQDPGVYTVSLTVTSNTGCTSTDVNPFFVQVIGPDVNFGANVFSGCPPLTVNFTDSTIFGAPIISWSWNFGDGNTSSLQNPTHTYTTYDTMDVTLTIIDIDGCTRALTFNNYINTLDDTDPTITCPADISVEGCGSTNVTVPAPVTSDNCTVASVTNDFNGTNDASGSYPYGTTVVNWTVTDGNGNTATCPMTVEVVDNISPNISCGADIIVNADPGACGAMVTVSNPFSSDICGIGAITNDFNGTNNATDTYPIGTTTVTWSVIDLNGNTSSCSINITVNDTENPTIPCPANITQGNDPGQCAAVVSYTTPVGTDNCPGVTTVQTAGLTSGSLFPVGTTTNTFEVTDAAGSTANCSFDVIINDTENPVISCPADIAQNNDPGQCGAVVNYTAPVGTDNCPGATTVQTAGLTSGSLFPVGTTTNIFEVTDAAGNTTSCSFDVIINDIENPVISCPANIVQNNDPGQCSAVVTYVAPIGTDNCAGVTTTQTAGLPSGSQFPVGTTTNTFEVTDAAGNSTPCSFEVIINDSEPPTISCQADISQNNDSGQCGAVVTFFTPVGTDNCLGSTTIQTVGLASGSLFPVGTTTNTFEVTDAAGNTTTCSFNVNVNDTENPVINCPANITQNNDPGQCGGVVTFSVPVGTDNCMGSVTVQTAGLASGSLFPIGTTTNSFTVTDAAGNTTSCSFDVVIIDNDTPVINCPADIAQNNDPGECGAIISYTTPSGTDNCAGSTTVQTTGLASGSLFPIGTTTNTFEVTDLAGNTSNCSFDVVITDSENPVIICPPNITQNNDLGQCGAVVTYTAPVGIDNCSGTMTIQTAGLTSGSEFPIGTTTNTFEVTDASGNMVTCSFNVIITDTENPEIICPANIASCDSLIVFDDPIISDNCPGESFVLLSGIESGSWFPVGENTNEYEVTDASGNTAICVQTITRFALPVIDIGPDLSIGAGKSQIFDVTVSNANVFEWTPFIGLDNSGIQNPEASPQETTTYTLLVTSIDGCQAEDEVTVTVGKEIEINNLLTPNGDGKNDTWIIKGHYLLDDCTIEIYNSWGNKIYESTGYDNSWDGSNSGKQVSEGNYYYVITCPSQTPLTGSITLVR